MVVAVEMVGTDECKEKTKNKYLLKLDARELGPCGCVACRRGSYWMWLMDADELECWCW